MPLDRMPIFPGLPRRALSLVSSPQLPPSQPLRMLQVRDNELTRKPKLGTHIHPEGQHAHATRARRPASAPRDRQPTHSSAPPFALGRNRHLTR